MKNAFWFILTALLIVATIVLVALGKTAYGIICGITAFVALTMAYRAVALQLRTIRTGMDLLLTLSMGHPNQTLDGNRG